VSSVGVCCVHACRKCRSLPDWVCSCLYVYKHLRVCLVCAAGVQHTSLVKFGTYTCLSRCAYPSSHIPVYLSHARCTYLSLSLCIYLSISVTSHSAHIPVYLCHARCIHLSISLCIYLSISVTLGVYTCLSLSAYTCLSQSRHTRRIYLSNSMTLGAYTCLSLSCVCDLGVCCVCATLVSLNLWV